MKRLLSVLVGTLGLFAYVADVSAGPPPSWELTQGAAGVCSGTGISLDGVEVNVPAPMFASEQGVLSAPGFPNLGHTQDSNFQGVGTFGFFVFTDPYTLPANTPLTLSVTTYGGPNFTGGTRYVSMMTWDCTTGQVTVLLNIALYTNLVDFDADGKTDIAVYRGSTGTWYIIPSGGGAPYGVGWGISTDKPVPGDYDRDGKTDVSVYTTSAGLWYVIPSSGASPYGFSWGGNPTDKPVPGDYDGDRKTDYAIYRDGVWFVFPSGGGSPYAIGWGIATDKPVPGDYNGDGKTDVAVYRDGLWFVSPSGGGAAYAVGWGIATDKPVPGDYDGDRKTDYAVYRDGLWFVSPSGGGAAYVVAWGIAADKPAPGDYDGDGKTDVAVYRGSTGVWYIIPSGGGSPYGVAWGGDPSDVPVIINPGSY